MAKLTDSHWGRLMELQSALMMGIRTGCLLETHSGCRMEAL